MSTPPGSSGGWPWPPIGRVEGLGTALLRAGIERCRAEGVAVVWAHARLTAVPWYEAHGLPAEGDVYVFGVMGLPHRLVVTDLG